MSPLVSLQIAALNWAVASLRFHMSTPRPPCAVPRDNAYGISYKREHQLVVYLESHSFILFSRLRARMLFTLVKNSNASSTESVKRSSSTSFCAIVPYLKRDSIWEQTRTATFLYRYWLDRNAFSMSQEVWAVVPGKCFPIDDFLPELLPKENYRHVLVHLPSLQTAWKRINLASFSFWWVLFARLL